MRLLEIQGTRDDYVVPYPSGGRPDRSFSPHYGWYYSAWENTTSLWAAQRGARTKRGHLHAASAQFKQGGKK